MNVAIVVAAGQGSRMGGDRPKQFLELCGIPIIIHTLKQFEQCRAIDQIIAVVPAGEGEGLLALASKYEIKKLASVVDGGATRTESVLRGLSAVDAATEIVAVHDGVRPLVTSEEIERTVKAARDHGAAILVAPETDTLKEVENGRIVGTMDRAGVRRALTPQCFRYDILRRAYEQLHEIPGEVTDDSMLVERLGVPVVAVAGSARNIKITQPEDFVFAEGILRQRSEVRGQRSEVGSQRSE
jgi:2-C-methyl-D-erythritol 4-phosphate cytidylyltransferase